MKRKIFSILLSLAMVFTMIPMLGSIAYAGDELHNPEITADDGLPLEYLTLGQGIEKTYTVKYDPNEQCILTAIIPLDEEYKETGQIITGYAPFEMTSDTKMKLSISADTVKKLYDGELTDRKGDSVAPCKCFVIYAGVFNGKSASLDDTAAAKSTLAVCVVLGIEDASKIKWNYSKALVYNGKSKTISLSNVPEHVKVIKKGYKKTKVGIYTAEITEISSTSEDYAISGYPSNTTVTWKIVPAASSVKSLASGKKKLTVKMGAKVALTGGSTYQIAYKQKGTSKWKYTTTAKQSKTIEKLKKGKRYYVKVRAYKTVSKVKYYGAWSKTKLSKKIK